MSMPASLYASRAVRMLSFVLLPCLLASCARGVDVPADPVVGVWNGVGMAAMYGGVRVTISSDGGYRFSMMGDAPEKGNWSRRPEGGYLFENWGDSSRIGTFDSKGRLVLAWVGDEPDPAPLRFEKKGGPPPEIVAPAAAPAVPETPPTGEWFWVYTASQVPSPAPFPTMNFARPGKVRLTSALSGKSWERSFTASPDGVLSISADRTTYQEMVHHSNDVLAVMTGFAPSRNHVFEFRHEEATDADPERLVLVTEGFADDDPGGYHWTFLRAEDRPDFGLEGAWSEPADPADAWDGGASREYRIAADGTFEMIVSFPNGDAPPVRRSAKGYARTWRKAGAEGVSLVVLDPNMGAAMSGTMFCERTPEGLAMTPVELGPDREFIAHPEGRSVWTRIEGGE